MNTIESILDCPQQCICYGAIEKNRCVKNSWKNCQAILLLIVKASFLCHLRKFLKRLSTLLVALVFKLHQIFESNAPMCAYALEADGSFF